MSNLPLLTRLVQSALHKHQFERIYLLLLSYRSSKLHLAIYDAIYTSSLPIYMQYGFIKALRNLGDPHDTTKANELYDFFVQSALQSQYSRALFYKGVDYVNRISTPYNLSDNEQLNKFQAHITELISDFTYAANKALQKDTHDLFSIDRSSICSTTCNSSSTE